jgi:4-aminobutyrate aminotransferase
VSDDWRADEGDINLSPRRRAWARDRVGEAARSLLGRDEASFLHQSLSTPCLQALARAEGIWIEDVDGRRYMDFHGNCVHQVGYGHPKVLAAAREQMERLPFSPRRFTNEPAVALAERLAALAPDPLGKVLFAPGGTLAIGMALKLARLATGRHKTLSLWNSFHGASLDAISIGGEALFRDRMEPLLPGALHAPPCDPRDCTYGCAGTCNARCAENIAEILRREGDVGAVVIETVRSTDVQVPPPEYYRVIREACDRHGTLLVLDEIPIALGRTGRMFAFERYGIVPDMVVLGKGLGGALFPMAALVARRDLDIAADRALGHYTHEKSSVGCAAALATLGVIEEERLCERSERLGASALASLGGMRARHGAIGDVRGLGLLLGVEIVDPATRRPAPEAADRLLYACLERGLSFKVGQGNVVVLAPPLTIAEADLERALDILEAALDSLA